uniref:A4_EXTRA domain-containing protein n=1 Tax=Syphacia muris TaxID=451379 RepID=A0A0N5ABF1_9BILA
MLTASTILIAVLFLAISPITATRIENVAANVDSSSEKRTAIFVPLVAFQCGYRNQFIDSDGNWISDQYRYATCMKGKLDILKYCKRAYPALQITNIVEYSHEVKINGWCKEEGSPCKWQFTVRPYQCIVGEFHSEALQVPPGCKFGHVSDTQSCKAYKDWETEASVQCGLKQSLDGGKMTVRSFAILEPCGLDLFTGVEYVCCPVEKESKPKVIDLDENKFGNGEADEDTDSDLDYTEDDDDDEDDESSNEENSQDSYFKASDLATEHDRYKKAEQRLERKYRRKFDKTKKDWLDLEERYQKMKSDDPKGAERQRNEMVIRLEKTENSLKDEYKEEKKQLEETHDGRVQTNLNEKKRQAAHDYRAALAIQVDKPNKHNVLKSLKAYIRAEEKDRTHMLKHFRHLLRSDSVSRYLGAATFKPILLHRLKYIDLRINSTLEMLRDFPSLQQSVRPIAVEFWKEYRGENTPLVTDHEYTGIGDEERYAKLLDYYEDVYNRNHNRDYVSKSVVKTVTTTTATTTAATTAEVLPTTIKVVKVKDSLDDLDDEDDLDDDDSAQEKNDGVAVEKVEQKDNNVNDEQVNSNIEADEDEDDDDDDDDSDDKSSENREINVEIEPIVSEPGRVHDIPALLAYAKHDVLEHEKVVQNPRSWSASRFISPSQLLIVFAVSAVAVALVVAITRKRRQHAGFIEVDVCTPEERHVNGMQVNGYENPTYTFFDGKP